LPRGSRRSYERLLGWLLLVAAGLAVTGCSMFGSLDRDGGSADQEGALTDTSLEKPFLAKKRNVVMILLESTGARSVTPYNEDMETTPFLDELARRSLVAERAYTTIPHTTKALVAAECGVPPRITREITEAEPDGIPARCLADLLKDLGYKTAFFQPGGVGWENRPQLVENFGHEELISLEDMNTVGFEWANYFGYEDAIMYEPIRNWLEAGDQPFFNTYKTLTPHHPYLAPTRYGRESFVEDDEINRYLNSVRYVDFFIKNIIEMYKALGLYEDTIFVIYGDHGEGFNEHGRTQHDNVIWEEGLKVPLIIHDPQRFQDGRRVNGLANLTDILPTVVDLLGYEVTGGDYPGYSLLDLPEDRTIMSSCWDDDKCMASLNGDEKYIYHYKGEQPEGMKQEQFFDLSKDPLEKNNLAESHSKELEQRKKELFEWKAENERLYSETG
jgi:lipoteichoic acid synthase